MNVRQRIRTKFSYLKLAEKMIVVFVALLSVCLSIWLITLQLTLKIYDGKIYEKSLQELDFFSQSINDSLDDVEHISYNIALDTDIQQQLEKITSLNYLSAEYTYEMYLFRNMLNRQIDSQKGIKSVIYTDRNKTRFTAGTSTGEIPQAVYDGILDMCSEAKGGYIMLPPSGAYPYMLSGRDVRSYMGNVSLEYLGSLIFVTDIAGIIVDTRNELAVKGASLCVYSDTGVIYEETEGMYQNMPVFSDKSGYEIIKYQNERYFLCYLTSPKTGWVYVNMFPYSAIFKESQMVWSGSLFVFFVLLAAAVFSMKKIAYMLTKPLNQLTISMQIVQEGDFKGAKNQFKTENGTDEISILSQEFGLMLDKIDMLIHENYEKQILLRDTKYKMLRAQINPHFLYNTLNAVNWMIRVNRNEDAANMIVVLGDVLRAAFSQKQYGTVKEEIELAKNYITIQEYRYQKRASFSIKEEGELESYRMPYMIIQPLIENAIYHGVENSLTPCQVDLIVREEETHIYIEVRDTGPGMDESELAAVRAFTAKPKGHGIGLKNIYERLRMIENPPGFQIDSKKGEGTSIKLWIPKMTEIEEKERNVQTFTGR